MKTPFIVTTACSVLLIAILAGGTLILLRRMHDRSADDAAIETVIRRGRSMAVDLLAQAYLAEADGRTDWSAFSRFVRTLHTVEQGLQYVSVVRDGIVIFHEQTSPPGWIGNPAAFPSALTVRRIPDAEIRIRREVLQTDDTLVPVVVFAASAPHDDVGLQTEVALRKETVSREAQAAGAAISSMFRFSLLTVSTAFALCILLVALMLRRERRHEAWRVEQEHLAFSGMLANGIVHDFRNPMSSLRLDAQMLEREAQRGPLARSDRIGVLAGRLRHTLDRMDEVFKAFLYAARPDSPQITRVDLVTLVRDAVATMASRLERARLAVDWQAPPPARWVAAFEASLRRALINVLTNAIDFSPPNGVIAIRIHTAGSLVVLEIEDQGPGIPASDRQRIFDMFVTTRPEGTGLGLFLAKAAIERSGGQIVAVAPVISQGACIRIELPAV